VYCDYDVKPTRRQQIPRQIALFSKADWTGFKEFASHLGDMILQAATAPHASTTILWEMFKNKINEGIHTFTVSPHSKLLNPEILTTRCTVSLNARYARGTKPSRGVRRAVGTPMKKVPALKARGSARAT